MAARMAGGQRFWEERSQFAITRHRTEQVWLHAEAMQDPHHAMPGSGSLMQNTVIAEKSPKGWQSSLSAMFGLGL